MLKPKLLHCEPPNIDELAQLFDAVDFNRLGERSAEKLNEILTNTNHCITAIADGRLLGIIRLLTDWHAVAYLCDLCVAPELQQKGIGTALIEEMLNFCDGKGLPILHILDSTYYPRFSFLSDASSRGMYRINPQAKR